MICLRFEKPVKNVSVIGDAAGPNGTVEMQQTLMEITGRQQKLADICIVMENINAKMNDVCDNFIKGHSEEIAKLSIAIARKILANKIEENCYRIDEIIKQTLSEMPAQNGIEIHLNPHDLESLMQLFEDDQEHVLIGHKVVANVNVGKAECEITGPIGTIKSIINDKLEHIEELLRKA